MTDPNHAGDFPGGCGFMLESYFCELWQVMLDLSPSLVVAVERAGFRASQTGDA